MTSPHPQRFPHSHAWFMVGGFSLIGIVVFLAFQVLISCQEVRYERGTWLEMKNRVGIGV